MDRAPGVRREKALLARLLAATGLGPALASAQRAALGGTFIRAVNYHDTPARSATNLEEHLRWYAKRFTPVGHADLDRFLATGEWGASRPGLIISFDDGLRSNYDVARPLLEKYGFPGW